MRLIDADALKEDLRNTLIGLAMKSMNELIDVQPTAYDIDKVMNELYEERTEILFSNDYENEIINYCLDNYDRAIEIVKQGLKEQHK